MVETSSKLAVEGTAVRTAAGFHLWFWQEFASNVQTHKPSVFIFGERGFGNPWYVKSPNFASRECQFWILGCARE